MTVDELYEEVMQLKPNNFMGLNGSASAMLAIVDSGTDSIAQLQRAVVEFARNFKAGSDEALQAARKEVIGKVLVANALDALPEDTADKLIAAVNDIMKGRKKDGTEYY